MLSTTRIPSVLFSNYAILMLTDIAILKAQVAGIKRSVVPR